MRLAGQIAKSRRKVINNILIGNPCVRVAPFTPEIYLVGARGKKMFQMFHSKFMMLRFEIHFSMEMFLQMSFIPSKFTSQNVTLLFIFPNKLTLTRFIARDSITGQSHRSRPQHQTNNSHSHLFYLHPHLCQTHLYLKVQLS